ncbi:hypothetical protein [Streptobacillus canis]|uniref:hypothetical protein n=1 Tax=Streptobacillus canis TaxID=2678686 RepID=UPI0012E2532E|nr:hypothetical protein [Streptobacillus canis]
MKNVERKKRAKVIKKIKELILNGEQLDFLSRHNPKMKYSVRYRIVGENIEYRVSTGFLRSNLEDFISSRVMSPSVAIDGKTFLEIYEEE